VESVRRALGVYHPRRVAYQGARWGRLCAERWALAAWQRAAGSPSPARHGRILTYHAIGTPEYGVNDLRPRDFERHLQIALDDGWSFATPAEVIAEPDKRQIALTFDDGLASVLANALPVLRHHGIPATAFVVTGWADGQVPDDWRRIALDWRGLSALQDGGMTLASHSVTHSDFGRLEPGEARRELEISRERLHQVLGVETSEFAIPMGQSRNWTAAAGLAAAEAGYRTVYAQCVSDRPEGTIARTFITRIDRPVLFRAALAGAYDRWEEWYLPATHPGGHLGPCPLDRQSEVCLQVFIGD
jgi:peptidoglycan/xylan/chitin deacetylase (PgdA/CDA1 family)